MLKKVKPGSIVLFHNAALHTPEALPTIIENLQKDGYKIVPVSQIILKENFTIDNSGMQIPASKNSTDTKTDAKTPEANASETQKANNSDNTAPAFIPTE